MFSIKKTLQEEKEKINKEMIVNKSNQALPVNIYIIIIKVNIDIQPLKWLDNFTSSNFFNISLLSVILIYSVLLKKICFIITR